MLHTSQCFYQFYVNFMPKGLCKFATSFLDTVFFSTKFWTSSWDIHFENHSRWISGVFWKLYVWKFYFFAKNSIAWSTSLRKGQVAGKASLRKHLECVNGFNCVEGDQTFKLLLNLDKTNFLAGSDSNQSAAHCFFSPEFTNKVVMSSPVPLLGLQQPPAPSNKSFPPIRHHDFFYTKTILLCNCSSWSNTCMSNSSNEYPACPFHFYF